MTIKQFLCVVILAVMLNWILPLACASADPTDSGKSTRDSPNVILMMADDIGYNDLSAYGSKKIRTPVLDKLAADGIKLTSFYAGAAVCTPSRMALLSGAYPARIGWKGGVVGHRIDRSLGMSNSVFTIAEAFGAAGYRTAIVGKWHIGAGKLRPMHQGFDESYYILQSNNQGRDVYRDATLVHENYDNRRLSETFTTEAIRVIREQREKPFFIYVPFTAPHFPAEPHPDWEGRSQNGAYGDVVEELDYRIGQILSAVEQAGIADETIVLFISDNGPEGQQRRFASAEPFRGGKWSAYEGGARVPAIIRYPSVIEPAQTSDAIISAIDLFPTLTHACGIEVNLPAGAQKLDGVNVWNTLVGVDAPHARSHLLYWHGWGTATAIRQGRWKLYFDNDPQQTDGVDTTNGPVLFDLHDDVGETTDISASHPNKVKELLRLAQQELADVEQHRLPLGTAEIEQ